MKAVCLPALIMALLSGACLYQQSAAEILILADKTGANLIAQPVSCDGNTLTVIRDSDKKTFSIPLVRLDESSQAKVKTWMSKAGDYRRDYEILVETNKNRRTTAQEDFDDKRVNLEPVVTIRNPDTRLSTPAAKMTVLFLGRPVSDNSAFLVFKKLAFDLPELPPLGTKVFEIGKISSAYDTRGDAKFGARYCGHVVIIHDADGKQLLDSASVPPTLAEKFRLDFLTLKEGGTYNRDLR